MTQDWKTVDVGMKVNHKYYFRKIKHRFYALYQLAYDFVHIYNVLYVIREYVITFIFYCTTFPVIFYCNFNLIPVIIHLIFFPYLLGEIIKVTFGILGILRLRQVLTQGLNSIGACVR